MESKHIEGYLGYLTHEKQLVQRTITEYKRDLGSFIYWCAENGIQPLTADYQNTRTYIRKLAENGLAKSSICRTISALRSFYKWANLDGHAMNDAAVHLTFPRIPEKLPVYLNENECKMLLESIAEGSGVNDISRRARIKLLYYCGLRAEELTGLTMDKIEYNLNGEPMRVHIVGKGRRNEFYRFPIQCVRILWRGSAIAEIYVNGITRGIIE